MEEQLTIAPHSIEAEQSVIGSLLIDKDVIEVLDILQPDDFYREEHRHIIRVMKKMSTMRLPIDIVGVFEELKRESQADFIGGISYLARLADSVPNSANALYYAKIVKDLSQKRMLMTKLAGIDYDRNLSSIVNDINGLTSSISYYEKVKSLGQAITINDLNTLINSKRLPTHFPTLDRVVYISKGELIVIVGDTSRGKTAFALNLADDFMNNEATVLLFAIDMNKLQVLTRFTSMYQSIELWKLKPHTTIEVNGINKTFGEIISETWLHPKIQNNLLIEEHTFYIDDVVAKIRATKPDIVIIDYVQNILSQEKDPVQSANKIMIQLQVEAQERPVIVLSQISKGIEGSISSRAKGSSTIIQSASTIIEIDRETGTFKYRIAKNRNWGDTSSWQELYLKYGYLYETETKDEEY